jgi:hypothetical protein
MAARSSPAASGPPQGGSFFGPMGIVGINEDIISTAIAPFGGMKEGGIGRERGEQPPRAQARVSFCYSPGSLGVCAQVGRARQASRYAATLGNLAKPKPDFSMTFRTGQ